MSEQKLSVQHGSSPHDASHASVQGPVIDLPPGFVLVEPANEPAPAQSYDQYHGFEDDVSTTRIAVPLPGPFANAERPQDASSQPSVTGTCVVEAYYQGTISQARREVFYRQAKLAGELANLGLPPLTDWTPGVKVGRRVSNPAAPTVQPTGRNPILQHERQRKAHLAKLSSVAPAPAIGDNYQPDIDPLVKVMARLKAVDGQRHILIEGMPVQQRPSTVKRAASHVPGNETEAGDLVAARSRMVRLAQARLKAANQKTAAKKQGAAPSREPNAARLQRLAEQLAALQAAGVELGIDTAAQAAALPATSCLAAPQEEPATLEGKPVVNAGQGSTSDDVDEDLPACHPSLQKAKHVAPDEIEELPGSGPDGPRVIMYPLLKLGARPFDNRGLPLAPDHLQQELAEDNAKLMNLQAYQHVAVAPANEVVRPATRTVKVSSTQDAPDGMSDVPLTINATPATEPSSVQSLKVGKAAQGEQDAARPPEPPHHVMAEAVADAGSSERDKVEIVQPGANRLKARVKIRNTADCADAAEAVVWGRFQDLSDAGNSDAGSVQWDCSSSGSWGLHADGATPGAESGVEARAGTSGAPDSNTGVQCFYWPARKPPCTQDEASDSTDVESTGSWGV